MSKSFQVVTVCNKVPREPYYCLREWFASLGELQPLVLGNQPGQYGGLGSKPRLLYGAIKDGSIKSTHVIFCDCFDLVFATSPMELFQTFLQFKKPFVISAEKNCFPPDTKDEYDKFDSGGSPYKYLNSGMIVAEVDALLTVLEAIDAPNIPNDYYSEEKNCMINPNDQEYYQNIFLKQPVEMVLDYDQILCNTLHSATMDDLDFSGERIRNNETESFPCSFHANGGAKSSGILPPILNHLKLR